MKSQFLQRRQHIVGQEGFAGNRILRFINHYTGGARINGLPRESIAIEIGALQSEKQITGL